ncbi:MAG: ferritin-like domain-containing protein [Actinomycetes bacterium]
MPSALKGQFQRLLAAEHTAVYGYGVAGAHLRGRRRREAAADLDAHRERRDHLRALIAELGSTPTPAAPAYALPARVDDAGSAARLLVRLEESVAAYYADLVAMSHGDTRTFAALSLSDAAVRAARWRGRAVHFPGLPERSTR